MKIRTDFVTNSSSSSFVTFEIKSKELVDFLKKQNILTDEAGSMEDIFEDFCFTCYDDDDKIDMESGWGGWGISHMNGDMTYLERFFLYGVINEDQLDYFDYFYHKPREEVDDLFECYEDGYIYTDRKERYKKSKECLKDHVFQDKYDGTEDSKFRMLCELFTQTNVLAQADIYEKYIYGGGEIIDEEALFCDYPTSGVECHWHNQDLIYYAAHAYELSQSFDFFAALFIEYDEGVLSVRDTKSSADDYYNVTWDDETLASTIEACERKSENCIGLTGIKLVRCKEIESVVLPEDCKYIGDEAFLECPKLKKVVITALDAEIGEDIVDKSVTNFAPVGSTAEKYANDNGLVFEKI